MNNLIYTLEKIPENKTIIFLAGPTYRTIVGDNKILPTIWREEAINKLREQGYNDYICVPEFRDILEDWTYSRQVDWEKEALVKSKVILFWIPREVKTLPAFTTNIEFGEWMHSGKIVVGAPKEATHMRYIIEKCSRLNIPYSETLDNCVYAALEKNKGYNVEVSRIWFTSDTHFGEIRTLQLSKRPFNSVTEMDLAILCGWNESVGKNDIVYHLGDFGCTKYFHLMNGKEIYLIPGNYDKPNILAELKEDKRMNLIENNTIIVLSQNNNVTLVHEPEKGFGTNFFLYGHIHKLQIVKKNGLNVGVDCHNFKPLSIEDVIFYQNAILKHYDKNVFMEKLG